MDAEHIDAPHMRQEHSVETSDEFRQLVRTMNAILDLVLTKMTSEDGERFLSRYIAPPMPPPARVISIPAKGGGDVEWWMERLARSESAIRRMMTRLKVPVHKTGKGKKARDFWKFEDFWTQTARGPEIESVTTMRKTT